MISIVEEKYVQVESGSSRYVEILCTDSDYGNLPVDVAKGSLAYLLDTQAALYFDGSEWLDVGTGSVENAT